MQNTGKRSESLDDAAGELLTENGDSTYSIRLPSEGDRIVTVPERDNTWIIAKAEALRMKLVAMSDPSCERRRSLAEEARDLMTDNDDGTYSIRLPYEDNRIITVPDEGNARVIARAAAARMRIAAL